MQNKERLILLVTAFIVIFGFLTITASLFAANQEKVLHSFNDNGSDGTFPGNSLTFDAAGNLYGAAAEGGAYGYGMIFQLTPGAGGTWTETVLHNFNQDGTDGIFPNGGLIFDARGTGNLYGTTLEGGAKRFGTVFQLTPGTDGTWTETILYNFSGSDGSDGAEPRDGLIFDGAGNLYGTTSVGGATGQDCNGLGCGAVFQLAPGAGGTWTETVLFSFNRPGKGGVLPYAGLVLDSAGNLYGTTTQGGGQGCGGFGCGIIFKLTPGRGGTWIEAKLHSFNGKNGQFPTSSLIFDAKGNLYGTARSVFQLAPQANGQWTEKVLHIFTNKFAGPCCSLIFDAAGNLYGTTSGGGTHSAGTVFELTPGAKGRWTQKVLHYFSDKGKDGFQPSSGLIFDGDGNLYGVTSRGGAHPKSCGGGGCGTVFEVMP